MNKVLITGLMLSSCASFAQMNSISLKDPTKSTSKDTSLKAKVSIKGVSQSGEMNKATSQDLQGSVFGHHTFYPSLVLKFDVGAKLSTGSSDSVFDNNEYNKESGLLISEGAFEYALFPFASIEAGALKMDGDKAPLLYGGRATLGLRENVKFSSKNIDVEFSALQSTPSVKNTSDRIDSVEEGTPTFFSESVSVALKYDAFKLKSEAMHFAYDGLSNGVAIESLYNGNSVTGTRESGADFLYNYTGWNFLNEVQYENNYVVLGFSHNLLVNNGATSGKNKGELVKLSGTYKGQTTRQEISLESFKIESDASVAYYNNKKYGHNNRKGISLGYTFSDLSRNFELVADATQSNIIKESDTQAKETIFTLTLRKFYDLF